MAGEYSTKDIKLENPPNGLIMGCVKFFDKKAGFGFISVLNDSSYGSFGNKDIFVHYSAIKIENPQYKFLTKGEYVEFRIIKSIDTNGNEKHMGVEITGIKNGKLMCETNFIPLEHIKLFQQQQAQEQGQGQKQQLNLIPPPPQQQQQQFQQPPPQYQQPPPQYQQLPPQYQQQPPPSFFQQQLQAPPQQLHPPMPQYQQPLAHPQYQQQVQQPPPFFQQQMQAPQQEQVQVAPITSTIKLKYKKNAYKNLVTV